MREGRSTTRRDHHRRIILRSESHCGICHEPVDTNLPYLHPKSAVVDHIIPINRGGSDTLDNKQLAHRDCNRDKGDRLPGEPARAGKPKPKAGDDGGIPADQLPPGVTFITRRRW